MKKVLILVCSLLTLNSCSLFNRDLQAVQKPRYHKGWYKDHVYHKKIAVGRVRVRWFEQQGTRTVRMK